MFYAIIKVLITAIIIIVASEIAKEKSLLAGLIISMPTVTVLALIWLYWDTHDIQQVKNLTNNTLLMILPSLTFFIFLPILLRFEINFIISMIAAIVGTATCYWIYTIILSKFSCKIGEPDFKNISSVDGVYKLFFIYFSKK